MAYSAQTSMPHATPTGDPNAFHVTMVAEPGHATHGTGLPNAAVQPAAPTFGPYETGGGSPGRWSQVQRLGDFVNGLACKMETWASELGMWQRTTETRITNIET